MSVLSPSIMCSEFFHVSVLISLAFFFMNWKLLQWRPHSVHASVDRYLADFCLLATMKASPFVCKYWTHFGCARSSGSPVEWFAFYRQELPVFCSDCLVLHSASRIWGFRFLDTLAPKSSFLNFCVLSTCEMGFVCLWGISLASLELCVKQACPKLPLSSFWFLGCLVTALEQV